MQREYSRSHEVNIHWFTTFGAVQQWVSDCGSHVKNELVRLLREKVMSSHYFTLAYCPWLNGAVEVACREQLRSTRALLSEFQLDQSCLPSVLPIIQSALNSTVLELLGNRSLLTVLTGLPQDSPFKSIIHRVGEKSKYCLLLTPAKHRTLPSTPFTLRFVKCTRMY